MGSGPILIFDKSLLEALSPDEAVWLGQFYRVNMTPLFLVETLADLELERVEAGRTPERIVRRLAEKTSATGGDANVHHFRLCVAELLGAKIEMDRVVVMEGGRTVALEGKEGVVFKRSEEVEALDRWRKGEFLEAERDHAKAWRTSLGELDLEGTYKTFRPLMEGERRPRNLKGIKEFVDGWLNDTTLAERMLGVALQTLGIPHELWGRIFERWRAGGGAILPVFAPYVAHVLAVELFFSVALAGGFIAKERPTNKVDMAYLYYLPFCMVFASMDKLHARTVPLFLKENQAFLWGGDLKPELKRLDEHYSKLPNDVKARGVMTFAHYPPTEGGFLTARLWDEFMSPAWREPAPAKPDSPERVAKERKILEHFKKLREAPLADRDVGLQEAAFVMVQHSIPARVGKWQIIPPEAVDKKSD